MPPPLESTDSPIGSEQRIATSERLIPAYGEREKKARLATDPERSGSDLPALKIINPSATAETQRLRVQYLQRSLDEMLPAVAMQGNHDAEASMEVERTAIREELRRGQFGIATRNGYQEFIDWLENKVLPAQIRHLNYLGLDTAEGKSLGSYDDHRLDLGVDATQPPTERNLNKLDQVFRWLGKSTTDIKGAEEKLVENFDQQITAKIKSCHLPDSWLNGEHSQDWRQSVFSMTQAALRARSYIEISNELNRTSEGKFPMSLPFGTTITRDADGNITKLKLELPESADLSDTENRKRLDEINKWLDAERPKMEPILEQLRIAAVHPERVMFWGDHNLHQTNGLFDAKGGVLGLATQDTKPDKDQKLEYVNLLEGRLDIDKQDNGRLAFLQHIQFQRVPELGYQNWFGVQDIGNKLEIKSEHAADDWLLVRKGDTLEPMQAKDVASYKLWEQSKHYGINLGAFGADVILTALGGGELVAYYRGLGLTEGVVKLGAAAAVREFGEQGLEHLVEKGLEQATEDATSEIVQGTARQLVNEPMESASHAVKAEATGAVESQPGQASRAVKGGLRFVAGSSGLINNAGAKDTEWGQYANLARSIYFLADVGGSFAWGVYKSRHLPNMAASSPVANLGATAQRLHRAMENAMFGTIPFTIGPTFYENVKQLGSKKTGDLDWAASLAIQDENVDKK